MPNYTVQPEKLRTFWRRDSFYLQPQDADYRLIIGRNGRNLEALRLVADFACRPSRAYIEVMEPERSTEPLPARPMVGNQDQPKNSDERLVKELALALGIMGAEPVGQLTTAHPEDFTTSLSVTTCVPVDAITRRSLSVLFGAIGRVRGRNVRIHINHEQQT